MPTAPLRTLRFAVGSALLALGGCTSTDKPPPATTEQKTVTPPKTEIETVNEGPITDTKAKPKPELDDLDDLDEDEDEDHDDDGDCKPPDCHANPGPQDEPKPQTKEDPKAVTKDPPTTKTPEPTKPLPTANPGPR